MALFRPAKAPIRGAVVLVTGAGSGIGELMAVGAAQRGAKAVCVWDVDAAAASRVAHEIERRGGTARAWRVDVADGHCVDAAAASVLAAFGRVDILVNNAGIVTGKRFAEMTEDDVERTFQVNVFSLYRTVRRFLPGMVERDRGSIVTIASAAGLVGVARQADYSASKFAAVGFTESLRSELRHSGSHVHTLVVAPYYIDTGMFDGVRTRVPLLLPILKPAKVADAAINGGCCRASPTPSSPSKRSRSPCSTPSPKPSASPRRWTGSPAVGAAEGRPAARSRAAARRRPDAGKCAARSDLTKRAEEGRPAQPVG